MSYVNPSIPNFKAQFVRDFPYAVPFAGGGSGAELSVALGAAGGGIQAVTVVAGGTLYPKAPTVLLFGGLGVGAVLAAVMTAQAISSVNIVNPGFGYTQQPSIYISNGMGDNTDLTKVTDYDLQAAIVAAMSFNINPCLFSSQTAYTYAYNLLVAHYLCENIAAGNTGIFGKAEWLTSAKTVGNVTEHYEIPDRVIRSPYLSKLSKTTYGAQFLELVSPQLIGNIAPFHRQALPA